MGSIAGGQASISARIVASLRLSLGLDEAHPTRNQAVVRAGKGQVVIGLAKIKVAYETGELNPV